MNYRAILKIYAAERVLTDDETAFLNALRKASDTDLELLAQLSASSKPQKKSSKKTAGSKLGGKSKHASSLQQQIGNRGQSLIRPPTGATADGEDGDDAYERCQADRGEGRICYLLPDHNIHHLESAMGYHPFVSYASRAASLSQAISSETQPDSASSAARVATVE